MHDLLGHANIKTTDTYLNATPLELQEAMQEFEERRKTCTKLAQRRPDRMRSRRGQTLSPSLKLKCHQCL